MAAGLALALAGCGATHVGEDWQCPLAQGRQCASVAAADPAVNDAGDAQASQRTVGPARSGRSGSSYRERNAAGPGSRTGGADRTASACKDDCDPFAWLSRLLDDEESPEDESAENAGTDEVVEEAAQESVPAPEPAPATTVGNPAADDARQAETIGRVWIAPFVDDDGVYREAAWVRIVIAPASWVRP